MDDITDKKYVEKEISEQRVLNVDKWTPQLWTFFISRPPAFQFLAGQYVRLGLADCNRKIWRAYSLVSAPNEEQLEFFGVLVPGGVFSELLARSQPGSSIWIEQDNYGFMTPDRFVDGEDLWMLATGTGLGPFISILRDDKVWTQFRRLILVHSVRHEEELAYQSELIGMQAAALTSNNRAQLQLIQCITQNDAATEISVVPRLTMRITTAIKSGELEKAAQRPLDTKSARVMMCGNPHMIEDTRKFLHLRGMKPCRRLQAGEFLTENYW